MAGRDERVRDTPYYSVRTGKNPNARYDLPMLGRLLYQVYLSFTQRDYFQQAFGYFCVDDGEVPGSLGSDIEAAILRRLRKTGLWPIKKRHQYYTEDDAFDMIELLYDCVSKPVSGREHTYNNCGWHYDTFNRPAGQQEFRSEINAILHDYQSGFELSETGEVHQRVPEDMASLFDAAVPEYDPSNVSDRVKAAKRRVTLRGATPDDKRDAVRDIADVLEYLRKKAQGILTRKDEDDLFNLANNFGIRHHNENQKTDYDQNIWFNWMFFYYLNTVDAVLHVLAPVEASANAGAEVDPDDLPF